LTASTPVTDYAFVVLSDAELQALHDEMRASSAWMHKERHRRMTSAHCGKGPCVLLGHRVDDGKLSRLDDALSEIGGDELRARDTP
jgi:hypothetical protein